MPLLTRAPCPDKKSEYEIQTQSVFGDRIYWRCQYGTPTLKNAPPLLLQCGIDFIYQTDNIFLVFFFVVAFFVGNTGFCLYLSRFFVSNVIFF